MGMCKNRQKVSREGRAWEGTGTPGGWGITGTKAGEGVKEEGVGVANHDESAKRSRLRAKVAQRILGNLGTAILIVWWEWRPNYRVEKYKSVLKWSESLSVVSNSLWPHGLCSPWNSPGQNTGVGSLSLLQGIFPTQGSNPGLPHYTWVFYQLSQKGSP